MKTCTYKTVLGTLTIELLEDKEGKEYHKDVIGILSICSKLAMLSFKSYLHDTKDI
jgi:hypothetical protein